MTSEMIKEKMMELERDGVVSPTVEQAIECLNDEAQFHEDMERDDL